MGQKNVSYCEKALTSLFPKLVLNLTLRISVMLSKKFGVLVKYSLYLKICGKTSRSLKFEI